MNAAQHMLGGALATSATYLVASKLVGEPATIEGLGIAALVGLPTGIALDVFEPATHPWHRGPLHSFAALAGTSALAGAAGRSESLDATLKVWVLVLLAGIISHFVLDACTSRGLPLTGLRRLA